MGKKYVKMFPVSGIVRVFSIPYNVCAVAAYLQYRNSIMAQVYICDKSASGMLISVIWPGMSSDIAACPAK